MPEETCADVKEHESDDSNLAETEQMWWHNYFVPAGRSGSSYTSFTASIKVLLLVVSGLDLFYSSLTMQEFHSCMEHIIAVQP